MPVPEAVKVPKKALAEPTLPVKVTMPEPAVRVRSLPETEASTLLLKVMLPLPCEVTTKAEADLVTNTSPLKAILELLAALTLPPREMVLVGVIAFTVTAPLVEPTVLSNATLPNVEVTLITAFGLVTAPTIEISLAILTAPLSTTPFEPTVARDSPVTVPPKLIGVLIVVTEIAPTELTVLPKVAPVVPALTLTEVVPVTAPPKLTKPVVLTVPPRVTAPPVELVVATDAAETAAPKPMVPVDVTASAPNLVAPTMPVMLTAPAPELMVRSCVPDTAPVIVTAPPVVVRTVGPVRVTAPVKPIAPAVVSTLPAVLMVVAEMPTAPVAAMISAAAVMLIASILEVANAPVPLRVTVAVEKLRASGPTASAPMSTERPKFAL